MKRKVRGMKFRKKPVVIDAYQMTREEWGRPWVWCDWLCDAFNDATVFQRDSKLFIKTLNGEMAVSVDEWIIRGVQGELYSCNPEIFEQTYERVSQRLKG